MSTSNQETSDSPPKKERKSWLIWIIGLAAFLFVIAASLLFPWFLKTCCGLAQGDTGAFGDQYGALNTFFSGLAFAGLVIAILLQREDLKLQREEMREARAEAAKQTEEAAAQTALMAEQTLSASLFSYIEAMQKNRDAIFLPKHTLFSHIDKEPEHSGREAILFLADQCQSVVHTVKKLHFQIHAQIQQTGNMPDLSEYSKIIDQLWYGLIQLQTKTRHLQSWVTPMILCNKRVHKTTLPSDKRREYEEQLFDSMTHDEQLLLYAYSYLTCTPLYPIGDRLDLDILWCKTLQQDLSDYSAIYDTPIKLLDHLVHSCCYYQKNEVIYGEIRSFYESEINDIVHESST